MQKYAPDGVDPTELLEMAVNAMGDFDWEAIFKPDLIDDCDGFDKDYLGEEEQEEVEKTEEEIAAEEELWDGEEIEDEDPDIDFDDKRFRRKNRLLTIILCEYGRKLLVTRLRKTRVVNVTEISSVLVPNFSATSKISSVLLPDFSARH